MGVFQILRRNEGVAIKTGEGVVEVIVRTTRGSDCYRSANFELRGVPGRNFLHLEDNQETIQVAQGLALRIRDDKYPYSRRKVAVHFYTNYPLIIEKYPLEE